jgi:hypothetical protein
MAGERYEDTETRPPIETHVSANFGLPLNYMGDRVNFTNVNLTKVGFRAHGKACFSPLNYHRFLLSTQLWALIT